MINTYITTYQQGNRIQRGKSKIKHHLRLECQFQNITIYDIIYLYKDKTICKRHNIPALLIEKFVLYRIREILTSDMYKERFEEQLKIRLETLQTKKKDISEIKGNITKLTNQKEKLLGLILEEESKEIIETYREKLNSILNQISVQNELLNVYSELDIKEEENLLRGKFKEFYSDISYKDFQELDREQQKTLFNNLIEKITIDELDIPDEKETCLSITIYMKVPGYEPKLSLQFKKDLKNLEKKKTNSYSKNKSSSIDGGEGALPPLCTMLLKSA